MELKNQEFKAMNSPLRRFIQRYVEMNIFRLLGISVGGKDVLEIGCGSGYGGLLISKMNPASYSGVDLMREQIGLAEKMNIPNSEFKVMDATDLRYFKDKSKDVVVIFTILHHIPAWQEVIREAYRVLKDGGSLFLEEPGTSWVRIWDIFFKWDHPKGTNFSISNLVNVLEAAGFSIKRRFMAVFFSFFHAIKPER